MSNVSDSLECLIYSCRVQPGCLGNIDTFTAEYVVPIETGQKQDASKRELATARKGSTHVDIEQHW